jgi:hypothetical protein
VTPRRRRALAWWLLIGSLVLGHANVGAFLVGWMSHEVLDTITNYLSWLAITFTALDLLATTDVRVEQEGDEHAGPE